jgi:hypothetical protein
VRWTVRAPASASEGLPPTAKTMTLHLPGLRAFFVLAARRLQSPLTTGKRQPRRNAQHVAQREAGTR